MSFIEILLSKLKRIDVWKKYRTKNIEEHLIFNYDYKSGMWIKTTYHDNGYETGYEMLCSSELIGYLDTMNRNLPNGNFQMYPQDPIAKKMGLVIYCYFD